MKIAYSNTIARQQAVLNDLTSRKSSGHTVVDVGGTVNSWSSPVVDVIVDINANRPQDFRINISNAENWLAVFDYVAQHGLFDYAICSHTLEDISNPQLVLDYLPKIAKQGIIAVPSIFAELTRVEAPDWLGYIHHRYIIDYDHNGIVFAPKLGFLERYVTNNLAYNPQIEELVVEWQGNINYSVIMNDYLGPDIPTVMREYHRFIDKAFARLASP